MNIEALIIRGEPHVVATCHLKLTRLPDLRLVWRGGLLQWAFEDMDDLLLRAGSDNSLLIIPPDRKLERREENGISFPYYYPFLEEDLRSKTLGDLRKKRVEELRNGAPPVDPLVAELYYHIKGG